VFSQREPPQNSLRLTPSPNKGDHLDPTQTLTKITRFLHLNPECELPVDLASELDAHGLNVEEVVASITEEQ
jgi:hypothetical protein